MQIKWIGKRSDKIKYQVMKDDVVRKMQETWSGITKWWEETKLQQATR